MPIDGIRVDPTQPLTLAELGLLKANVDEFMEAAIDDINARSFSIAYKLESIRELQASCDDLMSSMRELRDLLT